MHFINILKKIIHLSFILAFISLLLGCNQLSKIIMLDLSHSLEGNIYSHTNIPDNAEITLSISPLEMNISSNDTYSYHFKTNTTNRAVYFKMNIPEHIMIIKVPLGISVRIEKNKELIMMTNKITPLPLSFSEKMLLPVLSMQ